MFPGETGCREVLSTTSVVGSGTFAVPYRRSAARRSIPLTELLHSRELPPLYPMQGPIQ